MLSDPWHYPHTALAKQIMGMFESGISTALVFFAPRRMGKTEFLCKDITPLAKKQKWKVFYFSFLDVGENPKSEFTKALALFAKKNGILATTRRLLGRVKKINGEAGGMKAEIEFNGKEKTNENLKTILAHLAKKTKVLLLMDEIQALTHNPRNSNFIAALRTSLDIHKNNIKVIFTGSSQQGLRQMFSQAKAPFFHFGQNLPFPEFDQGFTDHLAHIFKTVTQRELDRKNLWEIFNEMQKIPQLARALVERLALNPSLTLKEAKNQLLAEVFDGRNFIRIWENSSALERLLLQRIASENTIFFSVEIRNQFAKKLGVENLSVASIQSAIRTLQRKNLIVHSSERGNYFIDDPNLKNWLLQEK